MIRRLTTSCRTSSSIIIFVFLIMMMIVTRSFSAKKLRLPAAAGAGAGAGAGAATGVKRHRPSPQAKSQQQKLYVDYLQQSNVSLVVAVGCAGTGKTWLACHAAANALQSGTVDRIVLTRPIVPVEGEDGLGFLPGSLASKMDPWTRPMVDALRPLLSATVLQKDVEMIPLMFMRGRTFDRAFIVADEMQNSTPEQMLMLVTRIGNESRLVITGDPQQSDRGSSSSSSSSSSSGLSDLVQRIESKSSLDQIRLVKLTAQDVQRSALVTELLQKVYCDDKPKGTEAKAKGTEDKDKAKDKAKATSNDQDCALIIDDPYLRRRAV
jgi:phosphate starvation-inducible PhoH-like protein